LDILTRGGSHYPACTQVKLRTVPGTDDALFPSVHIASCQRGIRMTATVFNGEKLTINFENRNPYTRNCKALPRALGNNLRPTDNMPFASHHPVALSKFLVPLLNAP